LGTVASFSGADAHKLTRTSPGGTVRVAEYVSPCKVDVMRLTGEEASSDDEACAISGGCGGRMLGRRALAV